MTDEGLTAEDRRKDAFWSLWLLMAAAVALSIFCLSGCTAPEPEIKIVTREEKDKMDIKDLRLPEGAKNVNKLDDEWHTFEMTIDGRTRKFIRRYFRWGNSATDAFTELTPQ